MRFKKREVNILVATDLASRGLDMPWVSHVINFDCPKTTSDYLHRAGRAGRAGRSGHVITFYRNKDAPMLEEMRLANEKKEPIKIRGSAYSVINKEDMSKMVRIGSSSRTKAKFQSKKALPAVQAKPGMTTK